MLVTPLSLRGAGLAAARHKNPSSAANASFVSGSSSFLLLFIDLLGIKQQESGLRPTYLLSVTMLILVAMQFSFLSKFDAAKRVIYEEHGLL